MSQHLKAEKVEIDARKFALRIGLRSKNQYVLLVHPQAWQGCIALHKGDRVGFQAASSVNIDLEGIISRVELRKKYEADVTHSKNLDRYSEDPKDLPERYYKAEQSCREFAARVSEVYK
jgi:hypothetical protein